MDGERVSGFGGTTGRVLCDAMSPGTVVTGMVLGLAMFMESFVFGIVHARALGQIVAQVMFAVVLARFALNGMSGETRGSLFSSAGGSWSMAVAVAGRYLVLTALWMIPMAIVLWWVVASVFGAILKAPMDQGGSAPNVGAAILGMGVALLVSKPFWAAVGLFVVEIGRAHV